MAKVITLFAIWLCFSSLCFTTSNGQYRSSSSGGLGGPPEVIKIGGLFDGLGSGEESAFKHAVDRYNKQARLTGGSRFEFKALVQNVEPENSYAATQKVCGMLKEGVVAIIGPQTQGTSSHVQSICDAFEIPHIETKWDFQLRKENYLMNLFPHPSTLSRAINDMVEEMEWKTYAIIYENDKGLYILQDLLKATIAWKDRKALVRQLPPGSDFRPLFRKILRETTIRQIILDCHVSRLPEVLKQAQQVGILTYEFSIVLTTLDLHTVDLDDYKFADVQLIAFSTVDPENPEVFSVGAERANLGSSSAFRRNQSYARTGGAGAGGGSSYFVGQQQLSDGLNPITTDLALIYDAVNLLGRALTNLLESSAQRIEPRSLNCEKADTWQHGYSVINYMKMVQMQGLTGGVQFNTTGFRTDVNLNVLLLQEQGLAKVGTWGSKFADKFTWEPEPTAEPVVDDNLMDLRNKDMIVTTIMSEPMTMFTRSEEPLTGNARYEGFVVDLLNHLKDQLHFNFTIKPVNDGTYPGMIREVVDGTADIAVADLTINKQRQEMVDFTMPFMNLGISILYVKPSVKPPSLFSFMHPFGLDVWYYMAFAFFGVSLILFILARLTPFEWDNPYPCIEEPEQLINQFTLMNSFWFTIGSIMQQGSDIAPKAVSTRMIAGIWWFFTLIMVSSYTANLATFLIVEDLDNSIQSLEDLPKQNKVRYGCVKGGSTHNFFKNSPFPIRDKILENMEKMDPKYKVYMDSNKAGIQRVLDENGGYAFFMESIGIEYNIERKCYLDQVGGLLDSKGYGIALKKGSKYRQAFSSAILNMQESGKLGELKKKWWKEERKENVCPVGDTESVKPLKLANVGGVFVVLIGGCVIAVLLAFTEFFWKAKELALNDGETYGRELMKELRFALACRGNVKPVRKKSSLSSTGNSNKGSKSSLPFSNRSAGSIGAY